MRHLTSTHCGQQLGQSGADVFAGLGRGFCPHCNGICSVWSRECPHCATAEPVRPARPLDTISLPRRTAQGVPPESSRPGEGRTLPADWIARLDALPSATLVHIPAQFRERMATAMAEGLEDLLQGGQLERGRSKLLLAPPPKGAHRRTELAERLRLWAAGEMTTLLVRIEEQARERASAAGSNSPQYNKGARARQLAKEGAYKKGVAALTSSVAILDDQAQARWAAELLPRARSTAAALSSPQPVDGRGGGSPLQDAAAGTSAVGDQRPQAEVGGEGDEGWGAGASGASLRKAALGGVRFPAMSAAGPSGTRPEHLNEALLARRRSVTSRLLRAIAQLVRAARTGALPSSAHWICDSRLVFLRKPGTDTPRPIRVGELWRRVTAKRFADDVRRDAQKLLASHHQCGVALPGGAEALIHLRRNLEEAAADSPEAVVILDLDLRNAFPSLEWASIREAVDRWAPALGPWTTWSHASEGRILLPCGTWIEADRGAEQGDPLGPLYCALTLLDCASAGRAACRAAGYWCWDAWYMDDGQVVAPPAAASIYVRAFDEALARAGGSRIGADGKRKSTAKLLGTSDAVSAVPEGWAEALCMSCDLLPSRPGGVVLGVGITAAETEAELTEATARLRTACRSLRLLDDPAAELALLRMSLNSCRVTHLLRSAGCEIPADALDSFDADLEDALGSLLGSQLPGTSWMQASGGAADGGLGLRLASDVCLPAYLASSIDARPLALTLSEGLPESLRGAVFDCWDRHAAAAREGWLASLPDSARGVAAQLLSDGEEAATTAVQALLGRAPDHRGGPRLSPAAAAVASLVTPAGAEDPELPGSQRNLQTRLSDLVGRHRADALSAELEFAADWQGVRRLQDLRDPETDHSWIWAACGAAGNRMRASEFCTALLLRLGAPVSAGGVPCAVCSQMMDRRGLHALRCAPGESTRGHNGVRDQVLGLATLGDGTSCVEPRGLVPSRPGLRPADIFSSAAFARQAALDVGIACPDAAGAGTDCCAALAQRKLDKYAAHLGELRSEGVDYIPLVWSCWGRPHEDAVAAIRSMAAAASRRRGDLRADALRARTAALVGMQLARRAARMVSTCLPPAPDSDAWASLDAAIWAARQAASAVDEWGCSDGSSCSDESEDVDDADGIDDDGSGGDGVAAAGAAAATAAAAAAAAAVAGGGRS